MRELCCITRSNAFAYPVCFNEMDVFNGLNHSPADMAFQTFLLDSANRVVALNVSVVDYGAFLWSERQERTITLTNTGQNMLVIHDVTTSCGCTKVRYDKGGIRPGKQAKLTVAYEAEKAEHFSKTVTVYCNAGNSPLRVKVTGHAE